jgi:hypothetical protein
MHTNKGSATPFGSASQWATEFPADRTVALAAKIAGNTPAAPRQDTVSIPRSIGHDQVRGLPFPLDGALRNREVG